MKKKQSIKKNKKKKKIKKNEIDVDSHRNNKLISKTQQRLKSERNRNNVFTEEINKIDLSSMMIQGCSQLIQ